MKHLILIGLTILITSCNGGGESGGTTASSGGASCGTFDLTTDMLETTYIGTTVTTSGTCDNGGQEYDISMEGDYTVGASATGWRLINSVLTTTGGNVNFTTGGRFMNAGNSENEGAGLTFTGVDNTTCQNALSINGSADLYEVTVTAEFDSNCNVQLRGTWREYSRCTDNSEVAICSGTITLTK